MQDLTLNPLIVTLSKNTNWIIGGPHSAVLDSG